MCAVVDGRPTIPDRWLSPLVIRIRTGSWGGAKRHEAVNLMKTRTAFPFLLYLRVILVLYHPSNGEQGENDGDQWLKLEEDT